MFKIFKPFQTFGVSNSSVLFPKNNKGFVSFLNKFGSAPNIINNNTTSTSLVLSQQPSFYDGVNFQLKRSFAHSRGYGFKWVSKRKRKQLLSDSKKQLIEIDKEFRTQDPALGLQTVDSFSAQMAQKLRKGKLDEVYPLVREKEKLGLKIPPKLYGNLMNSFRLKGDYKKVEELYDEMNSKQLELPNFVYRVLMDNYGKSGKLQEMEQMFQQLKANRFTLNGAAYTILFRSFAAHEKAEKIDEYWVDLQKARIVKRTVGMYNPILEMYVKKNDRPNAIKWYKDMRKRHIRPNERTKQLMADYLKDPY